MSMTIFLHDPKRADIMICDPPEPFQVLYIKDESSEIGIICHPNNPQTLRFLDQLRSSVDEVIKWARNYDPTKEEPNQVCP